MLDGTCLMDPIICNTQKQSILTHNNVVQPMIYFIYVAPGKFAGPVNKSVLFTEQGTSYLKITFTVSNFT